MPIKLWLQVALFYGFIGHQLFFCGNFYFIGLQRKETEN